MTVFVIKTKAKLALGNPFSHGRMITLDPARVFRSTVVRLWCIFWNCGPTASCEANPAVTGENAFVTE